VLVISLKLVELYFINLALSQSNLFESKNKNFPAVVSPGGTFLC
jgi:hypothetical protein